MTKMPELSIFHTAFIRLVTYFSAITLSLLFINFLQFLFTSQTEPCIFVWEHQFKSCNAFAISHTQHWADNKSIYNKQCTL